MRACNLIVFHLAFSIAGFPYQKPSRCAVSCALCIFTSIFSSSSEPKSANLYFYNVCLSFVRSLCANKCFKVVVTCSLICVCVGFCHFSPSCADAVSLLLSGSRKMIRTRAQSASQYRHGFRSACQSCHLRPLSDQAGRIVIRLFVSVCTKSSVNRSSKPHLLQPFSQTSAFAEMSTKTIQFPNTQQYTPSTLVAP